MKGNQELIAALNRMLREELTAINQYFVHAEMCENWGYSKLNERIRARAIVEMKHAEKLIERVLFLEGEPIVSQLDPIKIGKDVPAMVASDLAAEYAAVRFYNEVVELARKVGDNVTRDVVEEILEDEDEHANDIEELRDQIEQMGLQVFLSTQI